MSIRVRITLLFVLLVFIILASVSIGIYYFSYQSRVEAMKGRLTNRTITTARLLSQKESFDISDLYRIDSSTSLSITNKKVQIYDSLNRKIYSYSDVVGDTIPVSQEILNKVRTGEKLYFTNGRSEGVAYHGGNTNFLVVFAGEDVVGKENLQRLLHILIASFMVAINFIFILGYFFSRKLLNPIKQITKEITEISAHNLKRRIVTGERKDEWNNFSQTLNDLLDRLQESLEMHRSFISNASHELSTPLTSISTQLEVIINRERDPKFHRNILQSINQDVQSMTRLTKMLLQLAKTSESFGGVDINKIRIDEMLIGLKAEVSKTNKDYSVKLFFKDLPENEKEIMVSGNEILLISAIKNIVINACKYSKNNEAVVTFQVAKENLSISVEDNGIGIHKNDLTKIFDPFYRVGKNQHSEGFGLGLALATKIIQLHKGSIEVISEIGNGTTFTIKLPAIHIMAEKP